MSKIQHVRPDDYPGTMSVTLGQYRRHTPRYPDYPAMSPQDRLRQRYQTARKVWHDNVDVQSAAATIGMSERDYCDRYVEQFGPILGTSTTDTLPPPLDTERAYREARP